VSVPYVSGVEVARRLGVVAAADLLEEALRAGLDPESDVPRGVLAAGDGELLVMPSALGGRVAVKLVTVGGSPRVQGVCVVFDPSTLAPVALVDGVALTNVRTAAVSVVAARRLASPDARRLLVFGRGPQATAHAAAMQAVLPIERVDFLGRGDADARSLVAAADVICCCTTARSPLFDGALVTDSACVVAIGSHEPDARETDDTLALRSTVVVESRASALREAGDVAGAMASGAIRSADELVTLAELVRGEAAVDPGRPRLFKSTGMSWEDALLASAVVGT
jgi:ornithine cyclodeaminase